MNHAMKYASRIMPAALLAALVLSFGQLLLAQSNASGADPIQGTWRVTVTLRNCQNGDPIGNPFPSLLTFNQGGTLNESTANPQFYPNLRLPGEGYWNFLGNQSYQASSIAFITYNGGLVMTQRIDQHIALDGDKLQSDATVTFFDPQGKLIKKGCATAVAVRYK
jgi:hypothetical protein